MSSTLLSFNSRHHNWMRILAIPYPWSYYPNAHPSVLIAGENCPSMSCENKSYFKKFSRWRFWTIPIELNSRWASNENTWNLFQYLFDWIKLVRNISSTKNGLNSTRGICHWDLSSITWISQSNYATHIGK